MNIDVLLKYPFGRYCSFCGDYAKYIGEKTKDIPSFICTKCKKEFTKIPPEGMFLCPHCKGKGFEDEIYKEACTVCDGYGTITWTQKIMEVINED